MPNHHRGSQVPIATSFVDINIALINVNKLLWQITGGNKQHRLFDVQCLIGHIEKTSEKRITISESVNDFSNCLIPPNKVDKELSKIIKFVQQFKSQKQLKSDKRLELTDEGYYIIKE